MLRDGLAAGHLGAKVTAAGGAVLSAESVADAVVEGLAAERFLILPHPEVAEVLPAPGHGHRPVAGRHARAGRQPRDRMRTTRTSSARRWTWSGPASAQQDGPLDHRHLRAAGGRQVDAVQRPRRGARQRAWPCRWTGSTCPTWSWTGSASTDRKGAPETFDAAGFVHLLRRLRAADELVYAPELQPHPARVDRRRDPGAASPPG